jgi:glutathione S-transferase
MAPVEATLYVIPGSHPAMAVRRMLELKGIPYRRVDLMPVISRGVLRALRFPGNTVPSLKIDGRKLTGSREIALELDRVVPDPPLFPSDPERRAAVEEAERWGHDVLQDPVRRIFWNAAKRDHSALASFARGAKLGIPVGIAVKTSAPIVAIEQRIHDVNDEGVRKDLASLPGWLDRVDSWIGDGVLGAEPPNAADLQIAASLRLAMTLDDLREAIERRPAGELAVRAIPEFTGHVPAVLPPAWLEPLREVAAQHQPSS